MIIIFETAILVDRIVKMADIPAFQMIAVSNG